MSISTVPYTPENISQSWCENVKVDICWLHIPLNLQWPPSSAMKPLAIPTSTHFSFLNFCRIFRMYKMRSSPWDWKGVRKCVCSKFQNFEQTQKDTITPPKCVFNVRSFASLFYFNSFLTIYFISYLF